MLCISAGMALSAAPQPATDAYTAKLWRLEQQGKAALEARDYATAERAYRSYIDAAKKSGESGARDVGAGYYALAGVRILQERYDEALPLLDRSLEMYLRALGENHRDTAVVYTSKAQILIVKGRYLDAQPVLEKSLAIWRRIQGEDDADTAQAYNMLGLNLARQGRYGDADRNYERALDIRSRILGENHPDTAVIRKNMAGSLIRQGREADAARLLLDAKKSGRTQGDDKSQPDLKGISLSAATFSARGRYAEAEKLYEQVLEVRRRTLGEQHRNTAGSYNNVAAMLLKQGRYEEGAALMGKALDINRAVLGDDHPTTAETYANLAASLDARGRFGEAWPLYVKALAIERRAVGDDHPIMAAMHDSMAANLMARGKLDEAAASFEKSLEIRRRILGEMHPDIAKGYNNLAVLRSRQGRLGDAEALFRKGLDAFARVGRDDHSDAAITAANLAGNLYRQGRYLEALPLYERACRILRERLPPDSMELAFTLGALARTQNQIPEQATPALKNARVFADLLRSRRARRSHSVGEELQQLRDDRASSEDFLALADALWQWTPSSHREASQLRDEAFEALQSAVVSSTANAMAQMQARFDSTDPALRTLTRDRQDLARTWSAVDTDRLLALSANDSDAPERARYLRTRAELIERQLQKSDAHLQQHFPRYSELIDPAPLTISQVQSRLGRGEAMLLVVPGEIGTHLFVVSEKQANWIRSKWSKREIGEAVAHLRCQLNTGSCNRNANPDVVIRSSKRPLKPGPIEAQVAPFDRAVAFALFEQIVLPVLPELRQATEIHVVTNGALTSLPFSQLVTSAPIAAEASDASQVLRDTSWLIDEFAINYLPSVASLTAEGKGPPSRPVRVGMTTRPAAFDFVGFGDPVPATSGARRLAALPGTRVELQGMRDAFAPRSKILLGKEATESAVKNMSFEGTRVVAFATHALVAGELREESEPGLVLTPPANVSESDDGYLSASEAAQLRFEADWIILSACNTATSDGSLGADALSGLARAFVYAGARSLLVSNWPVRDDVASLLTVRTIQIQRANPVLSRAQALRQAMIDARERYPHPAAWSVFTLIGESRPGR